MDSAHFFLSLVDPRLIHVSNSTCTVLSFSVGMVPNQTVSAKLPTKHSPMATKKY
jgi:hypothetical protein